MSYLVAAAAATRAAEAAEYASAQPSTEQQLQELATAVAELSKAVAELARTAHLRSS